MRWYGWIPILSKRVLVDSGISRLRSAGVTLLDDHPNDIFLEKGAKWIKDSIVGSCFIPDASACVVRKKDIDSLRREMGAEEGDDIYYLRKRFDDVYPSNGKFVIFGFDDDGLLSKVGIFYPEGLAGEAITNNLSIDLATGLVSFDVVTKDGNAAREANYADHIFSEIRDVYHDHIYMPHGDIPFVAVTAGGDNKAIMLMLEQYHKAMVGYHKEIDISMRQCEDGFGRTSPREFLGVENQIAAGRGVICHAISFAKHFAKDDDIFYFQNSLKSLDNMETKLNHIATVKMLTINVSIHVLTIVAAVLASKEALKALSKSPNLTSDLMRDDFWIPLTYGLTLFLLIKIYMWYSTKKHRERYRR